MLLYTQFSTQLYSSTKNEHEDLICSMLIFLSNLPNQKLISNKNTMNEILNLVHPITSRAVNNCFFYQ